MGKDLFKVYLSYYYDDAFIEVKNYDALGMLNIQHGLARKAINAIGKKIIAVRKLNETQRFFEFGTIKEGGEFYKQSLTICNITISEIYLYYSAWTTPSGIPLTSGYVGCNYKTTLEVFEPAKGEKRKLTVDFQINENDVLRNLCKVINTLNIVLNQVGNIDHVVMERLKEHGSIFHLTYNPVFNTLQYNYNDLIDMKISFFDCWLYKYRTDDAYWTEVEIELGTYRINSYWGRVLIEALKLFCHKSYGVKILDGKILCSHYETSMTDGGRSVPREKIINDYKLQRELMVRLALAIPKIYDKEEHGKEMFKLGYKRLCEPVNYSLQQADNDLPF